MFISYLRTGILYLVLILVIRLMGKRQIGQMEPMEFVVTMLVANLASVPMQDGGIPLSSGLIPILTVLGMELVLSFLSMRSMKIRRLLCGKPVILIENGDIRQQALRMCGITLDELTSHLRQQDVLDPRTVQYAILETDGNLSVFPYPKEKPATCKDAGIRAGKQFLPITLVADGQLLEENLTVAGKTRAWVEDALAQKDASVGTTWLFTIDEAGHEIFYKKEGQP